MKRTIYWLTEDRKIIKRIRAKFHMPSYTSLNGETPCEINEKDFPLLKETEKRGFIQIRNK